ncbi:MAG TPA: vanadium-dependent haloperoxidase [Steroidobacteraceae bacterium]|nr:vanadium-dependent haloperoxidase [Steroidobacteraceae bacterium]
MIRHLRRAALPLLAVLPIAPAAGDVVTDWSTRAANVLAAAQLPSPAQYRALAVTQTAVYYAVNAVEGAEPAATGMPVALPGASVESAVATATHRVLTALVPSQADVLDDMYATALAALPDGPARQSGAAIGEHAAARVLDRAARDGSDANETDRPVTTPGVYVGTAIPVASTWPARTPWIMERADAFRPGPPPALDSATWTRDYAESREFGARDSRVRSAAQTQTARFWETTAPIIYLGVAVTMIEGRGGSTVRSARLLAALTQAMDDALIAVFDAKYHYRFWRPITAIRNGDRDDNPATVRDAGWRPLIETPMHPEYPCAHCILAGTLREVLRAEIGSGPMPVLATRSPAAQGERREWRSLDALEQEIANARIWAGVHYRYSTEVGDLMGRRIGELAATRFRLGEHP